MSLCNCQSYKGPIAVCSNRGLSNAELAKPLRNLIRLLTLLGVLRADEHQNEYLPAANDRLAWASGFTGSAGAGVILNVGSTAGRVAYEGGAGYTAAKRAVFVVKFFGGLLVPYLMPAIISGALISLLLFYLAPLPLMV